MMTEHSPQPFRSLPVQEQRRTARHLNLPDFGPAEQQRLHDAKVLVVGAGGLGSPAMQSLAAVGVGTIVLYDDDTVDITNLHRQILFSTADTGRPKVTVAAEQLRRLQPDIRVEEHRERLTAENILDALAHVDVVLDGSDTFATKYLVADAAEITGTPLVWATVLRYSGQLSVFQTGKVGLRDLFPNQPSGDAIPDCASAGVLGATTAVMGSLAATEVIKVLTGIGRPLLGSVLSYDALNATTSTFNVMADPQRNPVTAEQLGTTPSTCRSKTVCPDGDAHTRTPSERRRLLDRISQGDAVALDVREYHETLLDNLAALGPHSRSSRLAMSELTLPDGTLEQDAPQVRDLFSRHGEADIVAYCASGKRSQRFVEAYASLAQAHGVTLINLPGGVSG